MTIDDEDRVPGIERAIEQAARAGKLRAYVRRHGGPGLGGLLRLADRHSAAAKAALTQPNAKGEEW